MKKQYTESELYERYDEMLDEVSGAIKIGNLTYSASQVLKAVDPIAYRCGFTEWVDSESIDDDAVEWDA